ncbi:MAG: DNA replication and repair protein RecF [Spirochaetaceae bacterium]|nr:DNA replication and repair protein RecF [Spirochaetaceae bacterium]
MSFRKIRVASFRNLQDAEIPTDSEQVFLIGENGQGKTNFLEALYYLCYGASFRGQMDSLIPAQGSDRFMLQASWSNGVAGAPLDDEIAVSMKGRVKDITLNGKSLRDRKELVAHNPAVVFCHEDFSFAAGDPERRRFFFDQCAGMLSLGYIDTLRNYKHVLKQRNAALKESAYDLIDVLDPQFVRYGIMLMEERKQLLHKFKAVFAESYEHVAMLGVPVTIEYAPSWPEQVSLDSLFDYLRRRRSEEVVLGTTRSGPHRDKWLFRCNGENFTDKASTGQLRLISLVLRIIEVRLYEERERISGEGPRWPVLLLDDVLLELDLGRRRRLLELLPAKGQGAQSFFTFLPEEPWQDYVDRSTLVYKVNDGRFED